MKPLRISVSAGKGRQLLPVPPGSGR